MNKILKSVLFIVIAGVIVGMILYPKFKTEEKGPDMSSGQGRSVLPVEVKVISPKRVENIIKITGAVIPNESVSIRSEVSGKIENIYFREGQRIKSGDLLLTINDEEIVAQLERLRYTQQLNEEIEFRQRQLLEKEAISREEYDIALTTLKTTLSDIKEREARISKHRLRAPFDGIVGLRQVSEGSYLSPSDLVANIYNINPVKIEFAVPGKYSTLVNVGDSISFQVESSNKMFSGVIYAIEPRIDPRTRTLQIRAICPNDEGVLMPGQFANIDYILDVIPEALMVPSEAIIPEMNSHKLYTYKDNLVNQVNVEIGLRTEDEVQVVRGLLSGDTVITTGILQVRQGMPVNISVVN